MKRCGLVAAVALSGTLAGCVLMNPTDPYARPIGPALSRGPSAPPAGGGALPESLTLEKAVEIALADNPEIAARGWDTRAAEARRDLAAGAVLPSLHAVGGYAHWLDGQRLVPPGKNAEVGVFSDDIFSADLVVTMPLYTGGRLISEIRAAELLEKAAGHLLARSREELIFDVSSVFYGILAQRHVVESTAFSQKALEEHLRRVADLMAANKAAKVDRLRTEVRLADLKERLVREKNVLEIQGRVLANLLGGGEANRPIAARGDLAPRKSPPAVETNLAQAYERREDYLAARADLEAQAKAVDAARAARWPTVSLMGSYGGRWAAGASDHPSGTRTPDDVGSVGVVADVPIFEGGRIEAAIRQQKAELAAAQERLRKLELQIRLDVETATLNVRSAHERVQATQKAIEQGVESLRIEREKYDLGKGSITDVLDAQSALLDSQTNYYRALADENTASAQLRLAVGEP